MARRTPSATVSQGVTGLPKLARYFASSCAVRARGLSGVTVMNSVACSATLVQQAVHPDALTIFGAAFDETLDDEIRVTVIATGFDEAQQAANAAAVTQPAQTENSGAPQPLDEVKGEQGQDEMDKSFDEILRIFNKDKF